MSRRYKGWFVEVLRYAAFSTSPEGGNPAGVVLDAGGAEIARAGGEVAVAQRAAGLGERQPARGQRHHQ